MRGTGRPSGRERQVRLTAMRYTGLSGAVLLAAGAYGAGALPGAGPESPLRTGAWTPLYALGLASCVVGLGLTGTAWWRLRGADPGLRWVLTTGALWALPLLVAPPLGSRDVYAYACQGWLWSTGGDPYAGGVAASGCPWLDAVPPIWRDTPTPYGPLGVLLPGLTVAAVGDLGLPLVVVGLRLFALAGAALVVGRGIRLATACGVRPADAAWIGVVTPLALLHVASGAHHDALVAGLVVAGLAAALRRPGLTGAAAAGAVIGLAAAVKVTAVVALPFAALLAAGASRRVPDLARRTGTAAAGAVAAFAALTLAAGLDLSWVRALTGTSELTQWTSPPTGVGMAAGYGLRAAGWAGGYAAAVTVARVAGVILLAVVLLALWVRAARPPADARRTIAAAGWALAAVVLLGPVLYPWYALVPLAVLSAAVPGERTRRGLAVATVVLSVLVLPDGLGVAVLTKLPGAVAMALVVGIAGWAAARHARHARGALSPRPTAANGPPERDR